MNKKVYQQDIADALGISKNAVSRALRGCSDISKETIEKVKKKSTEMGYIPNNLSTYLASGKVKLFTVIVYNLKNVYFSLMADALIKEIESNGYNAIVIVQQVSSIDIEKIKEILATQCAGIFSLINIDSDAISLCERNNTPVSLIGHSSTNEYASSFVANDYQGSKLLGERLIQLKAKKPCYLCPIGKGIIQNRQKGIEEVLKQNNGPTLDIYECTYENDIYNYFSNKIKDNKNDYVVAYSDEIAINVKRILKLHAKHIYGFDGIHKRLPIISEVNGLSNDWDAEVKDAVSDMLNKIIDPSIPSKLKKKYDLHL